MSTTPASRAVATTTAAAEKGEMSFDQMQRLATSMVKSNLFGVKDVDAAIALMAIAVGEGKHPALIARDFDIINGRASKKSEAMLRDLIASGGKVQWHELTDQAAEATFSHPAGGTIKIRWDMARAAQAGLAGKDMYKKYPRAMLRSRCVAEGCRTVAPMVTSGMLTPEEARDIEPEHDVTPATVSEAVQETVRAANALTDEERDEHFNALSTAPTLADLQNALTAAYAHAKQAQDKAAAEAFKGVYEQRRGELKA